MNRVRVLLPVEAPAARSHEVVDVVDVEIVAREAEAERRIAHDAQLGVRPYGVLHRERGLEDPPRVLDVSGAPVAHHRGPCRREQPARTRALDAGRGVLPARPVGHEEVLAVAERDVAEREHRRALEAVAVLVGVGRDRRDAGHAEVEERDVVAELPTPRKDEAAEAAVDVEADAALEREVGQLADRVDGAVPVVTGRAHDRDRVLVDQLLHRADVDERAVRIDRRAPQLDAEQVARLVERGVPGLGLHEVRPVDAARLLRVLAVRQHRVEDAAAPARGDEAGRRVAGARRVGVEEIERHRDDLALELRHARAHVALQRVDVREELEGTPHELVVPVVAAVHRAGALAGLPHRIFSAREVDELPDDRLPAPPFGGHAADHVVRLGVGILAAHGLRASLIGRSAACAASNWT